METPPPHKNRVLNKFVTVLQNLWSTPNKQTMINLSSRNRQESLINQSIGE
jgi:hypothetical protein